MRVLFGSLVMMSAAVAHAQPASLTVRVDAVGAGNSIPVEFTCNGDATPPTISWSGVPKGTQTVAVLVDDPDAPRGTFTHVLAINLPATQTSLDLGQGLPPGASFGRNDAGKAGYYPPCPPSGVHHYHFRVYALDQRLGSVAMTRTSFLRGITGHVLASGELVGTYGKS
jgi:Raf kinase inhibitor-like YbhB/YbcL family protein